MELSHEVDLGMSYFLAANYEEAVRWYRKAAEKGNAEGQRMLGYCYDHGLGVKANRTWAAQWYRKAADQGDPYAQAAYGLALATGEGVVRNEHKAAQWLRRAADGLAAVPSMFDLMAKGLALTK